MERLLYITILMFCAMFLNAQVAITTEKPYTPDASAALEIHTKDPVTNGYKGVLLPNISKVEALAILNAATSLLCYDTSYDVFIFYDGSAWKHVGECIQAINPVSTNIADVYYDTDEATANKLKYYNGATWRSFSTSGTTITP